MGYNVPDLTLCPGKNCPIKDNCYRYRAIPSEYLQSYYTEPPFVGNECDRLIPLLDRKVRDLDQIDADHIL